MWSVKANSSYWQVSWLLINLWILFSCQFLIVLSKCGHGLESTCVWMHDPKTALLWQMKRDSQDSFVELTKCNFPDCGIGIIQTPWLASRDTEVITTLKYKIYGTSQVYMRLNLKLEDATVPYTLYSIEGNYAHVYPDSWTSVRVRIPPTHAKYKLFLKAYIPYNDALVAVRDINLDGSIIITSTKPTTTSATTTTTTSPGRITSSTTTRRTPISSTSTTTIAPNPENEEDDISPMHYKPAIDDISTHIPDTIDDYDYFPDDDDDDEDDRRFQALEVRNFMGEEDLTKGFTEVVEPKLCMFK